MCGYVIYLLKVAIYMRSFTKDVSLSMKSPNHAGMNYRLTGAVVHHGLQGCDRGHYTSFFRSTDSPIQWFHANDHHVCALQPT